MTGPKAAARPTAAPASPVPPPRALPEAAEPGRSGFHHPDAPACSGGPRAAHWIRPCRRRAPSPLQLQLGNITIMPVGFMD